MARVHLEDWHGREVSRVYIAGRLAEASRVEETLTAEGIDYALDFEPFRLRVLGIFPSEHTGLGFYVLSGQAGFTKHVLAAAGLRAGLEDDEPD